MAILRVILIVSVVLLINAKEKSNKPIIKIKDTYTGLDSKVSSSLLRRKRSYFGHCTSDYTGFTSDGGGNTVFLDRQNPDCGRAAMRSFRLARNNAGNEVRYEFSCCTLPILMGFRYSIDSDRTYFDSEGRGNVGYLDRHDVSCSDNGFLKSFRLNRSSGRGQYQYIYTCYTPVYPNRVTCYTDYTTRNSVGYWRDWRQGRLIYLDRHLVTCPIGYFLNEFQLRTPAHRTIQYRYRCCTYIGPNS